MGDRKSSFWLPLTLQTVALLVAANANQLAAAQPAELDGLKYLFSETDDAFIYCAKADEFQLPVYDDEAWFSRSDQGRFDYPVLLEQSDRLLLGAIDHYDGADQSDDDWLFVY